GRPGAGRTRTAACAGSGRTAARRTGSGRGVLAALDQVAFSQGVERGVHVGRVFGQLPQVRQERVDGRVLVVRQRLAHDVGEHVVDLGPFDARPEAAFPAGHVERRELQALVRAAAEHPQGGPQGGDVLRAEQVLDAAPRDVPAHGLLDGGRLERGQVLGGPALGAAVIPDKRNDHGSFSQVRSRRTSRRTRSTSARIRGVPASTVRVHQPVGLAHCVVQRRRLPKTGCRTRPCSIVHGMFRMSAGSRDRSIQTRAPGLPPERTLIRIDPAIVARRGRVVGEGPPRLVRPEPGSSTDRTARCRSLWSGSAARLTLRLKFCRSRGPPALRIRRDSSTSCPVPRIRTLPAMGQPPAAAGISTFSAGSEVIANWAMICAAVSSSRTLAWLVTVTGYTSMVWVGTSPSSIHTMNPDASRTSSDLTSSPSFDAQNVSELSEAVISPPTTGVNREPSAAVGTVDEVVCQPDMAPVSASSAVPASSSDLVGAFLFA